jgi:DNA-directed RNA polymerase specialized sigma24 family protein
VSAHPRHPDDLSRLEDVELISLAQQLASGQPPERETAARCLGVVLVRHRALVRASLAAKVPVGVVDELESDVLLRFTRKVHSGSAITNPPGLLLRMAHFARADYLEGRRTPEMSVEDWDAAQDDERLDQFSVDAAVDELLAPLSDRQRDVVWQRVIDGRSSAQVARANNTTPGNIDVIVHRSLARMREAST